MNREQAKTILLGYRPNVADMDAPELAEALELVRRDAELREWFRTQSMMQQKIGAGFKSILPPAGFREQILSERPVVRSQSLMKREIVRTRQMVALLATVAILLAGVVFGAQWLRQREARGFKAFSRQMVAVATDDYGMIEAGDLQKIRALLAERHAPADYKLPAGLEKLQPTGCAVASWYGRPVSMLCFHSAQPPLLSHTSDTWLVVVDGDVSPGAPQNSLPHVTLVRDLPTASWTADGKTYLLAMQGSVASLKAALGVECD